MPQEFHCIRLAVRQRQHFGYDTQINRLIRYFFVYFQGRRIEILDLPLPTGVTVIAARMELGRINHELRFWRNLSKEPRHFDEDYLRLLQMLRRHGTSMPKSRPSWRTSGPGRYATFSS
ncbi:MAG: hypothetical protein ABFS45_20790 [Pseudomonadota bacterium]